MNREELTNELLKTVDKEFIEYHFINNGVTEDKDKINFIIGYVMCKLMDILYKDK